MVLFASKDSTEIHDPWLGFDKVQHFTFSGLITLSSQYCFVNKLGMGEDEAIPFSAGISLLTGIGKEYYDRNKPIGIFSRRDIVANILGVSFAVLFITMTPSTS